MMRRSRASALAITAVTAVVLTLLAARLAPRLAAGEPIKLGTQAPKASPWGQVLTAWARAVKEKSGGRLELQIFYNGSQDDEAAMVAKIKAGQLDAALVSAVGLGKVYKPILALQMPGLFSSWAQLDKARAAMKGEFEKGAKDAGFAIVGWTDVGVVRLMSKGFAVRASTDLRGKKPFLWRDDPIEAVFFQVVGGVTPVPLNIPEVLPNLNTGAVDVVTAPALLSEQLQWSSKLDTIVADISAYAVGGIVISQKRLDALPADLRTILTDTGKVAAAALQKRIRSEDAAAFTRIKAKMTVVTLTSDENAAWAGIYKQVRARLGQGTFSADLITKLEGLGR